MSAIDRDTKGETPRPRKPRHKRVLGYIVLAIVGYIMVLSTTQILGQALFQPTDGAKSLDCEQSVSALYQKLIAARDAAAKSDTGERESIRLFRRHLSPEWSRLDVVRKACKIQSNSSGLRALRSVELLRYAEERVIRQEAIGLSTLRRNTPKLIAVLKADHAGQANASGHP